MPYIQQERRNLLSNTPMPDNAGELNYVFTNIALDYITRMGEAYQNYNDIFGAMECAKQELYRRRIAPYEDKKIEQNGDVF